MGCHHILLPHFAHAYCWRGKCNIQDPELKLRLSGFGVAVWFWMWCSSVLRLRSCVDPHGSLEGSLWVVAVCWCAWRLIPTCHLNFKWLRGCIFGCSLLCLGVAFLTYFLYIYVLRRERRKFLTLPLILLLLPRLPLLPSFSLLLLLLLLLLQR